MTGSLAVLSTENPTMLSWSLSDEEPLEAAQPDRMAGTARAVAVSARSLFRWIMCVSLFTLGVITNVSHVVWWRLSGRSPTRRIWGSRRVARLTVQNPSDGRKAAEAGLSWGSCAAYRIGRPTTGPSGHRDMKEVQELCPSRSSG